MSKTILRQLKDGLVICQATSDDIDRLSEYNARHLSDQGPDQPFEPLEHWTRDLMREHPTTQAEDFLYVEDTANGEIVSSLCLIPQTWTYCGIPFTVGRVELVSTKKEYRRKGLVRAQFEILHEISEKRGNKMQAITGIPNYYRQFGYEMALELGGGRVGYRPHVPKLKEGEQEPYQIRNADKNDISFLISLYQHASKRHYFACPRDEYLWAYELNGRHEKNIHNNPICIIETTEGTPAGCVWHIGTLWGSTLAVFYYELMPGYSWKEVTPSVIRYMMQTGEEYAAKDEEPTKTWEAFFFNLGSHHPVYSFFDTFLPRVNRPYAWYIRISNIPDFILHIAPALEKRLEGSELARHSGTLELNFYHSGTRLEFQDGKIVKAEPWQPSTEARGHLSFPGLSFIQLICGHRTFDELDAFYPDCSSGANNEARALINVLFPKNPASVLAIV